MKVDCQHGPSWLICPECHLDTIDQRDALQERVLALEQSIVHYIVEHRKEHPIGCPCRFCELIVSSYTDAFAKIVKGDIKET